MHLALNMGRIILACSGESTRYLLIPALSTASAAMISMPSTSHSDATTHSFLKSVKYVTNDPRLKSQCACENNVDDHYQNSTAHPSLRPFLTPPPRRKIMKCRGDNNEVLENVNFMLSDQYTPLVDTSNSSQNLPENQYLIITSRGVETNPVYNTIGRTVERKSSLPTSIRGCSRSLETMEEKDTPVMNHMNEHMEGVLIVPAVASRSQSPPALNNSVHSKPSALHRFEERNSAATQLQADYISLEDLFSSCV